MKSVQKLTLTINPVLIILVLIAIILIMLGIWRPWEGTRATRTITVTGQAEVQSIPDEFTFSPYFLRSGTDTAQLRSDLNTFGNQLVADVTKLGISKDDITINSSANNQPIAEPASPPDGTKSNDAQNVVSLSVTIKASNKELAQKVQDYLATTNAQGQVTANPDFSKSKRTQLEDQARDKATQDARSKADQTAKNLGGSLGKVISVKDDSTAPPIYPLYNNIKAQGSTIGTTLPVTPGKASVSLSVDVVFELR